MSDPLVANAREPKAASQPVADHTHEWQPNGSAEVDRVAYSPCSTLDDVLWTDVIALAVCPCGAIKRDRIGQRNKRRRGDARRRQSRD